MYKLNDDEYLAKAQELSDKHDAHVEKLKEVSNKTVISLDFNRLMNNDVKYVQEVFAKTTLKKRKIYEEMAVESANFQLWKFGEKLDA